MAVDPEILENAKIAFAALCGGMTRLLFKPAENIRKTVWLLFGCVTCGYYGTPALSLWLAIGPDYAGAVGAALGLVGLSFAQGALTAADKFDIIGWFSRHRGAS